VSRLLIRGHLGYYFPWLFKLVTASQPPAGVNNAAFSVPPHLTATLLDPRAQTPITALFINSMRDLNSRTPLEIAPVIVSPVTLDIGLIAQFSFSQK